MLGYGLYFHTMEGIETSLFARAFVIADETKGTKLTIVNCELGFITIALKKGVLAELERRKPNSGCTEETLMLTAQHTLSTKEQIEIREKLRRRLSELELQTQGNSKSLIDAFFNLLPGERYSGYDVMVSAPLNVGAGIKGLARFTINPYSQVLLNKTWTNQGNTSYVNNSSDGTVRFHQEFGVQAGWGVNYKNVWETRDELGHMDGMYKSDVYEFSVSYLVVAAKLTWGSEGTSFFYGVNV